MTMMTVMSDVILHELTEEEMATLNSLDGDELYLHRYWVKNYPEPLFAINFWCKKVLPTESTVIKPIISYFLLCLPIFENMKIPSTDEFNVIFYELKTYHQNSVYQIILHQSSEWYYWKNSEVSVATIVSEFGGIFSCIQARKPCLFQGILCQSCCISQPLWFTLPYKQKQWYLNTKQTYQRYQTKQTNTNQTDSFTRYCLRLL